jgi:2-polyprenyl-3-methyl-5-hydroxy-6-metoxy-1,4-benzoquinol methylase
MSNIKNTRNYDREFQDNERKYHYNFDDILRQYTMQSLNPFFIKGNALEMGCFQGAVTKHLIKYFYDLSVIEASKDLIQVTKNNVTKDIKFIHSTFEDFNAQEKFDNIFLIHTLEHLDNPVYVLEKIKSWLAEKGRLFLVCPNANAPSRQIAVKMGLIENNSAVTKAEHEHGHRITYSLDTLERDVRKSGLKVIQRGGIFFKALANFQFDKILSENLLSQEYLDGCYMLGQQYPDLCASIYLICERT